MNNQSADRVTAGPHQDGVGTADAATIRRRGQARERQRNKRERDRLSRAVTLGAAASETGFETDGAVTYTACATQDQVDITIMANGDCQITEFSRLDQSEDQTITIAADNVHAFLDRLCDALGVGSAP